MKKHWRILLGCVIGGVIFYFVVRKANWQDVWQAWKKSNPFWLAAAALCTLGDLLLKGIRWMIILEGKRNQLATFIKGTFLGIGASTFLPLRAGEFIKIFFISQKTKRSLMKVAFSVIIERFFDVAALGLLLFASFFLQRELMRNWLKTFSLEKNFLGQASLILIVAAVALVGLGLVILKKTKFRGNIEQLKEKLHLLPHRLSRAMFLSCVIWSVDILFVWCMAQGFKASFELTSSQIVFLFTVLATAFLTSIAPGALGIYEFLGLWVLTQFGQPQEKALAFLLAAHGITFAVLAMATLFAIVEESWMFQTKKLKELKET